MRPIRATVAVAALAAAALAVGCDKPNLDATGGGYDEFATGAVEADTGAIAPLEGPAPLDSAGAEHADH